MNNLKITLSEIELHNLIKNFPFQFINIYEKYNYKNKDWILFINQILKGSDSFQKELSNFNNSKLKDQFSIDSLFSMIKFINNKYKLKRAVFVLFEDNKQDMSIDFYHFLVDFISAMKAVYFTIKEESVDIEYDDLHNIINKIHNLRIDNELKHENSFYNRYTSEHNGGYMDAFYNLEDDLYDDIENDI